MKLFRARTNTVLMGLKPRNLLLARVSIRLVFDCKRLLFSSCSQGGRYQPPQVVVPRREVSSNRNNQLLCSRQLRPGLSTTLEDAGTQCPIAGTHPLSLLRSPSGWLGASCNSILLPDEGNCPRSFGAGLLLSNSLRLGGFL